MTYDDGMAKGNPRDLERRLAETAHEVERDPPPGLRPRISAALRSAGRTAELPRSRAPILAWTAAAAAVAMMAMGFFVLRGSETSPEPGNRLSVAEAVPRLPDGELTFLFEPFVGEARLLVADLEATAESLRMTLPRRPDLAATEPPEESSSDR